MNFINWGHESPEQLEIRRRLEQEQALYEQAARAARTRATAMAGSGGPRVSQVENTQWVLQFSEDQVLGYDVYPQSVAADSSGNVYTLSIVDQPNSPVVIRKISSAGEVQWTSSFYIDSANYDPQRLRFNTVDNFLYALYNDGIQKIDPADGTQVWDWWTDSLINEFVSIGFLSDGRLATLSNFKSEGDTLLVTTWSEDIESGTLAKETEHEIYLFSEAGVNNLYANADLAVDPDDNLILPLDFNDGEYGTCVLKWSTLSNAEVWRVIIREQDFNDQDQDATGLGVDGAGNIYVNGYGRGLTKIDPAGNVLWARVIDQNLLYGLGVLANGDAYMYGDDSGSLYLLKFSAAGEYLWANEISSEYPLLGSDGGGWWNAANSMMQAVGSSLYFVGQIELPTYDNELIFKTFGTLIEGQFGPFEFSDATADFNPDEVTVSSYTEPSVTAYASDYLAQEPISFESATVTQDSTKTNLP